MSLQLQPLTESLITFATESETHIDNRQFVGQWTTDEYRRALNDPNYQCFVFMADDRPVGHCILYELQNPDNAILLKRIIVREKGNGYGRAALGEIANYVFTVLKANRLWLDVRAFNTRAEALYQSVGFVYEGTQRKASLLDGVYYDLKLYGMLREEYQQRQS